MTVLGLDLSLTSTGYAWLGVDDQWQVGTVQPGKLAGGDRLARIEAAVKVQVLEARPKLAVIEGYSRASKFGREEAGEIGGVIRLMLCRAHVPYAIVAPDTLKLYATGSGAASKAAMQTAAFKRAGQEFDPRQRGEDEADAWWLACAGLEHLGTPAVQVPKAQVAALAKADWPVLAMEGSSHDDLPILQR